MRIFRFFLALLLAFAILPGSARAEVSLDTKTAPYGLYKVDPEHTSITFKINHMGFSHFTGRFDRIEGYMNFNNNSPELSTVDVTVYPNSVDMNNKELEEDLKTDKWFDVIKYPHATFHATRIDRTGPVTGKVTGDFTLLGIKRSLVLDATFIGTGVSLVTGKQVLGFSAITTINRSDYGMSNMLPLMGNEVVLEIEAEFDKAE